MKIKYFAVLLLVVSGCYMGPYTYDSTMKMDIAREVKWENVEKIKMGETTRNEVIALLGKPQTRSQMGNSEVWIYFSMGLDSGYKSKTDFTNLYNIKSETEIRSDPTAESYTVWFDVISGKVKLPTLEEEREFREMMMRNAELEVEKTKATMPKYFLLK